MSKTTREPRVISIDGHTRWGSSVEWWTAPDKKGRGRVVGWLTPRPQPGDRFTSVMVSGRIAIFEAQAKNSRYPTDPSDQFFLDVKHVGFVDEA